MPKQYLTEHEVAERLRVKPVTLRQWRWRRVGPPYLKAGGRVLYDPELVYQWEQAHLVETEAGGEK